jgi:hypothetical protein
LDWGRRFSLSNSDHGDHAGAENRLELAISFLARATIHAGSRSATSHQWYNIDDPARNARALA